MFPRTSLGVLIFCAALYGQPQAPAPCLEKPAGERAYAKDRLMNVVTGQSASRAEYLIRTCGVAVVWSDGLQAELKAANASDKVIQAVRDTAGKPVTPPINNTIPPPKPPPVQPTGPKPGDIRTNSKEGVTYAFIPPGTFEMGCHPADAPLGCEQDDGPVHKVRITKGFWMAQNEIKVGVYKQYVKAAQIKMPPEPSIGNKSFNEGWAKDDMPISGVSWMDAHNYCQWAGMRLPTEAEWEYAARGPGGSGAIPDLKAVAWFADNSGQAPLDSQALYKKAPSTWIGKLLDNGGGPHEVGQKAANGWKLHDMLGNVGEWTADWYREDAYMTATPDDPTGPDAGFHHVLRGGSWLNIPSYVRVSKRLKGIPDSHILSNGFRCAGATVR